MKQRYISWLRLLMFSWLAALASSLILAAVLVGVTLALGSGEPPRMPERSGNLIEPGQTFSGTIVH